MMMLLSITVILIAVIAIRAMKRGAVRNSEWTAWAYYRDRLPRVYLEKGIKVYEHSEVWIRRNKRTGKLESTTVINPVRRPLNQAKSLNDIFFLRNQ